MKCRKCRGHGCPDCRGTGRVQMKMKTKGIIAVVISVIFYGLLGLIAWRLGI